MVSKVLTKIIEIEYPSHPSFNGSNDDRVEYLKQETIRRLKQEGIYDEHLLYRGFQASRLKRMLRRGTDRTRFSSCYFYKPLKPGLHIFAAHENRKGRNPNTLKDSIWLAYYYRRKGLMVKFSKKKEEFTVVCYDSSKFTEVCRVTEEALYLLKEGVSFLEALKAVIVYKPKPF